MCNEDGTRLDHLQRRDLQLRRAARRADRPRPHASGPAPTPRSSSTSTRSAGPIASRRSTATSPSRSGMRASSAWCWRATAWACARCYYTVRDGALRLRLRGEGAARGPGRRAPSSTRSRSTRCFTFWFPLAPRTPFKDISELPPGARADRASDGDRDPAVLAPRISRRRGRRAPVAAPSEAAIAEELRALLLDADAHPPARRRAGRRLSERRPRFLDHDRRDQAASCPTGCAPSRSRSRRRSSTRARSSRRWSRRWALDHSHRRLHAPPTSPAFFRTSSATPSGRSCAPRRRRCSMLSRAGARQRLQGGADRRGRRRGVRRLRHLQGGEGAPLLRRASRLEAAPAAAAAALSVPAAAAGQSQRYLEAFFGDRARARSTIRSSRTCRASHQRRRQGVLLAPTCASSSAATTRSAICASACRPTSALASAVAGAVPRERATCCRATSSPRRATASAWRTRSRAASRSSITAWSSSPRASRRA